jgi:hypothetical protein
MREKEGVAALVLANLGVRLDSVREWILTILSNSKSRKDDYPAARTHEPHFSPEKKEHPLVYQLNQMLAEFRNQIEWCVAKQQFEEAAQLRDEGVEFRKIMDRIADLLKRNPALGNPEQGRSPSP